MVVKGFAALLSTARGARTYLYVLINAVFRSGISWLAVYFIRRYGLGAVGIGLALLGYGIPGFVLGPVIGRAADRWGRRVLIPVGLALGSLAVLALVLPVPLVGAALAVTLLSLGYDMTQPLFAGIVTSLDPKRAGQAMGLNVFCLFTAFGVGSFMFGELSRAGFAVALVAFAAVELVAALGALVLFRDEASVTARDDS